MHEPHPSMVTCQIIKRSMYPSSEGSASATQQGMADIQVKSFLCCRVSATLLHVLNFAFAALAVLGQVGQNVSLPLWTGSSVVNCNVSTGESADNGTSGMDPYFVLSSASFSFVIIFGLATIVTAIVSATTGSKYITKDDLRFPQWQLFLIGFFDALNGVFVVFASIPKRTAPFLQAILGNFLIPLTIAFRLIILRKRPTLLKLICAGFVLLGLVLSLIPVITGMDRSSADAKSQWLSQPTVARILWPLCFMFGFIPAALMNVIEEKSLKDTRNVNLFYLLFCTSVYQLLTVGILFWVDILPGFGFAEGIQQFGQNYWFAIKCFFGQAGCNYAPGVRGTAFISMYVLSYVGGGLLLRYAEGATYLAVVQTLVTPLGALFWSIFQQDSCGNFFLEPHADSLTYFSIGGIVLMVPAIFFYNIGYKELKSTCERLIFRISGRKMQSSIAKEEEVVPIQAETEKTPLLEH